MPPDRCDPEEEEERNGPLLSMRAKICLGGLCFFVAMGLVAYSATPHVISALRVMGQPLLEQGNDAKQEPPLAEDNESPEKRVVQNDTTPKNQVVQNDTTPKNLAADNQSESTGGTGDGLKPVYLAWNRTFPEVVSRSGDMKSGANKIIRSPDGAFLVLGETEYISSEGTSIHLIKIDGTGRRIWEAENVGAGIGDSATQSGIAYCEDGSYLVVSRKYNLSSKYPWQDHLVLMSRTDDYGYKVWEKVLAIEGFPSYVWMTKDRGVLIATRDGSLVRLNEWGERLFEGSIGNLGSIDLVETADGGYLAVWLRPKNMTGPPDFTMLAGRFDRELNPVWTTPLRKTGWGGARMFECSDGGVLVLASGIQPRPEALTILKIGSRGEVLWNTSYANATPGLTQYRGACTKLKDGGFLLTGSAQSPVTTGYVDPPPPYYMFVLRFGQTGEMIMEQLFEMTNVTSFDCAIETEDGGFLLAGHWSTYQRRTLLTGSYIVKLDPWGNRIWEYGNPWLPSCAIQCGEGEYLIGGSTKVTTQWNRDGFVLKLTEKQASVPEPTVTCVAVDMALLVMLVAGRKPRKINGHEVSGTLHSRRDAHADLKIALEVVPHMDDNDDASSNPEGGESR